MNKLKTVYNWKLFHKITKPKLKKKSELEKKKYTPKIDSDKLNPKYLYQGVATDLLVAIVNNQIDPVDLANKELRNRGLDSTGKWVGF